MRVLYNLFLKKSNICSHILGKIKKIFRSYTQCRRGRCGITNKKHAAALQRKPARREEKGDPQAGQRGRLFAAGLSVAACFFVPPVWERRFELSFERLRSGLFLGVSLSAAARSAAALVYDKLTPNCHPIHSIPSAYSLVQALFYRRKLLHPL